MELKQQIALNCNRPNFTDCNRCVVKLLCSHLIQADENNQTIGQALNSNVSFPMEQAGRQLIIRVIPDQIGEQYLLLLLKQEPPSFSIAALELLGLTKREAEVLFWIAKDKSNVGIARVLGCGEGTVRKHLENLYKKLGVQTRMGAVMVALETLGLLKF